MQKPTFRNLRSRLYTINAGLFAVELLNAFTEEYDAHHELFDSLTRFLGDLAESLRRVQEEGGKVIKAMQGKDGEYVYAVVRDLVGAYLALMPG